MPDNILFYVVFLSQIVLISYYLPSKVINRMKFVLEKYPPSEYPKLYPRPIEDERKGIRNFRWLCYLGLAVGIVLFAAVVNWDMSHDVRQKHAEGMPLFYGMFQFIPYILMELSGFKQFKLMRKADARTIRQADLEPRRLFDFVSPWVLMGVVLINIGYVFFEFYMPEFQWQFGEESVIRVVMMTLVNVLFIGITIWNLSGKKVNPYQSSEDRKKQIRLTIRSLILTSTLLCIFLTAIVIVDALKLGYIELIINSMYFQAIALASVGSMLHSSRAGNTNFDVYKGEAEAK